MSPSFEMAGVRGSVLLLLVAGLLPAQETISPDNVTTRNFFGEGVTFNRPTVVLDFPGMDSTYLVLEQTGGMYRMEHDGSAWTRERFDSAYVTGVNGRSNPRGPGEGVPSGETDDGGLMGFAFHPNYPENRKYFIKYVDPAYPGGTVWPGTIVIAERTANSTLRTGSGDPQRVILALPKPFVWHSGGTLRFGKNDAYLYTAIGDGGSGGDPQNRAQDPGTLHGKMLRIDVDSPDAFPEDSTRNYAFPEGNPFVEQSAYYPEIWAIGLRSPWRWDFHPGTGEIWLGDVGQSTREKVTRVPKGGNLGWKIWEGFSCFSGPCSWEGYVPPLIDLPRSEANSVSGGVFFEGFSDNPYDGTYIFGDYGRNNVWSMRIDGDSVLERSQIASIFAVVSFNKDYLGQIQAVSIRSAAEWDNTGTVQALESPLLSPEPPTNTAAARGKRSFPTPGPILATDVVQNPGHYEVRTLDGRLLRGAPSGMVWVRAKKDPSRTQLLTILR